MTKGKLICGVGNYIGSGEDIGTAEYQLWKNMLYRCYSPAVHRLRPTYVECSVAEEFKDFQYFAKWCRKQIGFGVAGCTLDKDLLVKGNKVYSEDTCVFIPHQINTLLNKHGATRGCYPIGVSFHKATKKFTASMRLKGSKRHLGLFNTPEEAFLAYKKAKEIEIASLANEFKSIIDTKIYEALLNYSVENAD